MEFSLKGHKVQKEIKELSDMYILCQIKGKKCNSVKATELIKILTLFQCCKNFREVFTHPTFKQLKGHELKGDRKGYWGLDCGHPFRLIFHLLGEYDKSKAPSEYEKIDKIEIIEIVDYH